MKFSFQKSKICSIVPMVKGFLIAHPLAKILGKKYVKLKRKNSSFQKPKNIPSSTKTQGGVVFQS